MRYTLLAICIFWACFPGGLSAQDQPQSIDSSTAFYTDINKIYLSKTISSRYYRVAFIERNESPELLFPSIEFQKRKSTYPFVLIPHTHVAKKALVKFNVQNSGDTAISVWFFPGFYFWNVELYREKNNQLQKIHAARPPTPDSISYRQIILEAHDSATIVAALTPAKTYLSQIGLKLINKDYLRSFINEAQSSSSHSDLLTYIFCGLLLMMILYSLSNYVMNGSKEFFYYSGYAFFVGFLLFLKALYTFRTTRFALFQEEFLDFIMQNTGMLFYILFMQRFLSTRRLYPFLHKLYNIAAAILVASSLSYSWLHFFSANFELQNNVENATKIIMLALVAVFLVYSITKWKDTLLRYLFWGNLCLFVFALLSQLNIMIKTFYPSIPPIFRSSLFYYEVGLFLELVFFLAGLNHKNRKRLEEQASERERLRAENQMKEYEKELAVLKAQQQERERISTDMHDELGSGMTAIRLMSEIARNKMKEDTPVEIEKISNSANEVLNKMNAIIWSMNSDNDSLDNLVSYIRSYAIEYFESTPVNCRVNIPTLIEHREISGDKRRNIFLCVKETLNNTLKHAQASEIKIDFDIQDKLTIRIHDNGKGIDMDNIRRFGNGLKNMNKRMTTIGGTYQIENNNGTLTILTLPL